MAASRFSIRPLAIAGVALAAIAAVGTAAWLALPAQAQEADEPPQAEVLTRDIQFLSLLRSLEVTAQQRRSAADAVTTFRERRRAIMQLAQPEALIAALTTIRETLLRGEQPTDEMHEAVEVAHPEDDGSVDGAFRDAAQEYFTTLEGILDEGQKKELAILPLVDVANEMIYMAIDTRDIPPAEREEVRTNAFGELREQLAEAAGADAKVVLADFQARLDHLLDMTPEQIEQQHAQLVEQMVTMLSNGFSRNAEIMRERLRDQLIGWAEGPQVAQLLIESAEAMEAR